MKKRLAALARHRQTLLVTIESQRVSVSDISQRFQKPIAIVDMGLNAARFFYRHPKLLAGCIAAALALCRKVGPGISNVLPYPLGVILSNISAQLIKRAK